MKKKVTALCLCVALLAVAVVGASLAYFTDTKTATNTFTVGNVKIDLIESRFHREGNDNSGDTSIPDPTQTASGTSASAEKTWFPVVTLPSAPMWSTPAQMMLMSASV